MSTLTDFLLARIAEDEVRYRDAAGDEEHQDWALNKGGDYNEAYIVEEALRHLAECEAKRRIIGAWNLRLSVPEPAHGIKGGEPLGGEGAELFYDILKYLALPYADHPEYRDEWRP